MKQYHTSSNISYMIHNQRSHNHRYHYHHFINILCYAPSVFTCIVGGAIRMTVYIYIHITVPLWQRTLSNSGSIDWPVQTEWRIGCRSKDTPSSVCQLQPAVQRHIHPPKTPTYRHSHAGWMVFNGTLIQIQHNMQVFSMQSKGNEQPAQSSSQNNN